MNRRHFIKTSFLAGLYLGTVKWHGLKALAADPSSKILLNIVLGGGPDLRHLIVPPFSPDKGSYGYQYWSHRYFSHAIANDEAAWSARWTNAYLPATSSQGTFGILSKASWLKEQFEAGRVALANNVVGAGSRDHSHALLTLEAGDLKVGPNDFNRDGWGGRLVKAVDGNLVSMTNQVRLFCNGPHESNPKDHDNKRVIAARDSRNLFLFTPDALVKNPASTDSRAVMARALSSYYDAKRDDLTPDSPFYKILQHQQQFRKFGDIINARLAANPVPPELAALTTGATALHNTYFARQLRNVFDSLVCSDILNFRVGSLEYNGWDSHKNQAAAIEPNLEDLFGKDRGLATLFKVLEKNYPEAASKLTVVISGEFGRQLAANGDQGTDHGRGNTVIVIGPGVNGGVYGEMFPASEIPRYEKPSADIVGKTSIEHVFGAVADWMGGAGNTVFPNRQAALLESGVSFSSLMKA